MWRSYRLENPVAAKLVLLIEDNAESRELLRDVLEFDGYEVAEAVSAEEGLVIARSRKPALILMDIQLPKMNGIDALKIIRADPELSSIPVVAVTASVMLQEEHRVKDAGFDAFQRKPINVKATRELITRLAGETKE
jgi:two-component system, cell cycle response regulator DivK